MPSFASLGLPNDATKLRFKEPFVSEAMNLKDAGIVPPGIFRGFTSSPQPGFLLNFNVDVSNLDSVAVVETTQHYNMTVRANSTLSVDMTGQVIFPVFAVLRTTYGITPTPLAGFTFSNILIVKPTLNNADPQSLNTGDVKLCKVLGFIGTVPNISSAVPTERQDNGGPLLTQASALQSALTSQEAENATGTPTTNGTTTYAVVPGTLINLTLSGSQTVFFEGCVTAGNVGFGGYNTQIGVRIDGIDYDGQSVKVGTFFAANDLAGLSVAKAITLGSGPHTAQLILREAGGSGSASVVNGTTKPSRLTALYTTQTLVPPTSCLMPGFFTDCFTGLFGPIPQGGWSGWVLGGGGSTTFDGDQLVQTVTGITFAGAQKLLGALPPVATFTMQFKYMQSVLPGEIEIYMIGADGKNKVTLILTSGGSITIRIGNADPTPHFTGVFTSIPGADRIVHMTADAFGVPSLWIDFAPVPLVASGVVPAFGGNTPNTMVVALGNGILVNTIVGKVDYLFVDTAIHAPTTIFCCPGGSPAQ